MTVVWTETDRQAWLALLDEARACTAKPSRKAADLGALARKAFKAVIPTADGTGRADCYRFIRFAQTFAALDDVGRADNAGQLATHEAVARLWVQPPAPGEPEPVTRLRPRADIDG